MNAPQIPPPGPTAASSPSGAAGLVVLPSKIVRLPQELAARLLTGPRTVFVSGTVTGQGADGTLNIRSQFGEISVRAGTAVPPDRQISLQIPPLSGKAATLTPHQLSRSPIPASLLLSNPVAPQISRGGPPAPNAGPPAGTGAGPTTGQPTPTVPTAPLAVPRAVPPAAPPALTGPPPTSSLTSTVSTPGLQPGSTSYQPPQAASGPATVSATASPTSPAAIPTIGPTTQSPVSASPHPSTNAASPSQPVQLAGGPPTQSPINSGPAPLPGNRPLPSSPPLGRLALTAQLMTQASGQPTGRPAAPSTPSAAQPGTTAPQQQAVTPQNTAASTSGAAPSASSVPTPTSSVGAQISATGAHTPSTLPTVAAGIGRDTIPPESVRRVPALREAISVLSAADPTLATQFVRSILPQANSQLAATLLFFLSATRSGDVRGWMGDRVTSTLDDAGRTDLLPRLSAELATPSRAMPDAPAGEWRSQTIPLYQDGEIGGMAVHVRRPGEEGGDGKDGEAAGQRFLIDMDLSRMGPLQFDGVVHETRFDLTIRSPVAFPEPMRQDMRTLFHDASNAVGLHGGLTFQTGSHDWASVATAHGG